MENFTLKITTVILIIFCCNHFNYAQDNLSPAKSSILIITKKANAKKITVKAGNRVKILKQNAKEVEGRVTEIRNQTIYFKKDSVTLADIYSLEKKNSIARQLAGGLVAGVGSYFIVGGVLLGVFANTRQFIIIGSVIDLVSIPILIQKTYNTKKWEFRIE
jgi:hypothetical protein